MEKIKSIKVLDDGECKKASFLVHALNERWIQRYAFAPFYTLGVASYLDANKKERDYYKLAIVNNLVLENSFSWLYQKIVKALETHLQAPVSLTKTLALPGFHIYLGFKLFELSVASIHYDLQQKLVNWEKPELTDFETPISFTLPVSLPQEGGGLNLWNITYQDNQADKQELKELVKSKRRTFYSYELGQMIIHSGFTLHQAIIGKNLKPDEDRITIQGHALFSQGSWQLYW